MRKVRRNVARAQKARMGITERARVVVCALYVPALGFGKQVRLKVSVAVLVPVLDRPARVQPLADSFTASMRGQNLVSRMLFICSPHDQTEIDAVLAAGLSPLVTTWGAGDGDYARKINLGFQAIVDLGFDWALLAADDLSFHQGWATAALRVHEQTGACVVGTNDLGNPEVVAGRHATHSLVHRDYLECGTIDEPGKILHEGYFHNWVDTEFCATAKYRGTFAAAPDSHVEHLHHFWRKGEDDSTYALARSHYLADRRLFDKRKQLWT